MYFLMVLVSWFLFKHQDVIFIMAGKKLFLKVINFIRTTFGSESDLNCAVLTYM